MTRLVFMGTPAFSVPILERLVGDGYEIAAVVTQPDRPVGRKKQLTPPPVKEAALRFGVPVLQPEKLAGSPELHQILQRKPDLVVTAAFGQLLPNELLDAVPLGCINVHASLLPAYRGGAPIHQAVIDGCEETGVTIMYMAEKLDAGDIIAQRALAIGPDETTGELFDRLSALGADLLAAVLPSILEGTNDRTPQDHERATFARNIARERERIDWARPARDIHNLVRGLCPRPGAFTTLGEEQVKIWKTTLGGRASRAPGTIVSVDGDAISIAAGDGQLVRVLELQPAGKTRVTAASYLRGAGASLREGDRFL